MHVLSGKGREEEAAVVEANMARFVLITATRLRNWRHTFAAGTDTLHSRYERGCWDCAAVRCDEVAEVVQADARNYKRTFGSHKSQVGHNTGSSETA